MKPFFTAALLVGVVSSTPPASMAADSFFGKWRFVPAKSELGGATLTIARSGDEYQHRDDSGKTYTFKMDGKRCTNQYGHEALWKPSDGNTWEVTYHSEGKVIGRQRFTVSADGKTLTDASVIPQGGKDVEAVAVFQRSGAGSGLVGCSGPSQLG